MIDKCQSVLNEKVIVTYSSTQDVIIVQTRNSEKQKVFSGFNGLNDRYNEFESCFSDQTDYDDAITHFTPQLGNFILNN